MRAVCLFRDGLTYRRDAFCAGLRAAGYAVVSSIASPQLDDVLCIWNRYGNSAAEADRFERGGGRVIVCENGHLGKTWRDGSWYAMAGGHHGGAGCWGYGGPERWDGWNVELAPWRADGSEIVILAQRGIGEPGVRSPRDWAETTQRRLPGSRVRPHPGKGGPSVPLEHDLRNARAVVTWHSAAAASALLLGVPVFYDCPSWLGARAGLPLAALLSGAEPKRDDAARLDMFRNLAWGMWQIDEIKSGVAFNHLLQ